MTPFRQRVLDAVREGKGRGEIVAALFKGPRRRGQGASVAVSRALQWLAANDYIVWSELGGRYIDKPRPADHALELPA